MPQYEISVPGQGTFRVDSPTELTDQQAWQAVQNQLNAPQPTTGAFAAGVKSYLPQVQETFGGLKTLLGVGAERMLGEGQISRGLIESGAASMKEAEAKRQPFMTAERASFTDALDKGVGAVLTEWLPYQAGSGAMQLLESLGLMGAGALAGSALPGPGTIAGAGTGLVARELAKQGVKEAAEKILKERGEDAAKAYFENEAKKAAAKIGGTAALASQAAFYGTGQTTSRAVEEAQKLGGTATDIELARVLPAAAVSTVAEFIGDKIALGALKGIKPGEPGKFVATDLAKNILLNIGLTGTKEVPVEVIQSAAERFGAKLSLTDAQALKEYIDATAASYGMAVAPGVGGGVRQTMAERARPVIPEAQPVTPETPAAQPPVAEVPPAPIAATPEVAPTAPETPVTPVAETPVTPTVETPVATAPPTVETPAAPVAETPPVETTPPVTEQPPAAPSYASMTLQELQSARENASATNLAMDVAAIQKYMGLEAARAYEAMTQRQRDRWWDENATEELEKESSVFKGVNEETIDEYIKAYNAFDTESPQLLGRSVALSVRNINDPKFVGSPEYVTLKNALAYASEKGWSEKEVLDAMRARAIEWAGADAQELFKDLFKKVAKPAAPTGVGEVTKPQAIGTTTTPPSVEPVTPPQNLQEFQERMPIIFDSAEVRAANNEGNFAQLTKALQRSSNPAIRRIGQLGGGIASKITLKKPGRLGGNTAGRYTYDDDAIQMIPSYAGDEHTNAHEVLHALISKSQRNPTERQKPIVQKIDKLYEHVKRELKKKGITVREAYGLKNAREFTAEAMTNPKFQYELMQIPYPGRKTAWTQFVQLVSDLLGIQNTNALTEVMNLVDRLAQTKQPRKTVTDKGLVDESIAEPEPTHPKGIAKVKAAAQKALQKQPMPEKGLSHVKQDLKNLAQPIFFAQNKTILDRIDGMKDRFWQRVAQKTADQFRTIKEYSPVGYMQARLSKSVDGGLEGLLFHGQVVDDGGALNIKPKTKGMVDILKPLGNELDSYLMWVALNRESRLPDAKRSKIPNMDQLVARRDEFAAGDLNGKPRVEVYEDVLRQMNQLNKSVLDIALAKGLIDQKAYDKFSGDLYYIPFYKKMEEDGDIAGAQTASGLTSQYFSKELKGGDKPFGDLMENVVRNWSHILSASMKNAAAKTTLDDAVELGAAVPNLKVGLEWKDGQVYSIKSGKPVEAKFDENGKLLYEAGELRPDLTKQDAGMAKVMVDGQPMYFKVTDDLLMDSISSIGYLGPKSAFLDVARNFKNMLQYGVTASPIFKVNNLIRDSVAAMAVSDLKKNPVANVLEGVSLSKKDSPTYISALAGGAIFNFGSAYEGDQAKLIKRLLDQGVPSDSILDTKEKITKGLKGAWDAYQHLGDRSEAANRLSLYQQLRDKGMTHLQASFMARDLLDFSMQGSWPAFRLVTQVVPFMNARIQGLYKLGRDGIIPTTRVLYNATTGKEIDANDKIRAAQFATITTAVMLASALLYLSFKDDEDFKKRDAWDRDNFWWIKLPGMDVALRVPKPFEVGAFGTLVERTLEQILDQGAEGKQFGESLSRTLWDTFALNPTPQMFKPLVDIYANKDSFSGAPIESAGLERLSKQERATDQTSPLAIALGGITSIFPEKFQLSPVQMDYMLKGYFGWLGAMASVTSTYAVMPFKEGEYPDARWLDRASLGLARELPAPQSAYVTQFYNASKEISQAYADMRHYREMGDAEKVQEILEEKGDKIALAKFYDKTAKNIANVRKQIQLITNDNNMDGAEKREAIERMKLIMSDLAKQAEEVRKSMK